MTTETQQQECPMTAQPQKEHEWLQQLVGEWTFDSECIMGPDQPPMKSTGSETVRSLGGLWTVSEGVAEMPGGGPCTSIITLGYDPQKGAFVGTFVASVMAQLWTYTGELNDAGNTLTLSARGPSMAGDGTMANYRDVIEIKSADERVFSSHIQTESGEWVQFMTAHYRRKK